MKIDRLLRIAADIFYGKCCAVCGEPIPLGGIRGDRSGDTLVCDICREQLNAELHAVCRSCGQTAEHEECVPELLQMSYIKSVMYASYYDKTMPQNAVNRLILSMKRTGEVNTTELLGGLLAQRLCECELDLTDFILTNPPRRAESVRETGIDHAALLAKETAKLFGLRYMRTLRRSKNDDSEEQKSLGATDRFLNLMNVFEPVDESKINGGSFIIVDDVVTTGATVFQAAECLRRCGARDIIVLAVCRAARIRM